MELRRRDVLHHMPVNLTGHGSLVARVLTIVQTPKAS
jgi:hypothetical protein